MFILELIPDDIIIFAVGGLITLGIIGIIVEHVIYYMPPLIPYRFPIKIISNIILIIGIYFAGVTETEKVWKNRVAEIQAKLIIAEANSQNINTIIQEKIVEKTKIVKHVVKVNHTVIQKQL